MTTNFTPTIASLTRDIENADRAASDRLAHCKRLTQENAALIKALQIMINGYSEMMRQAVKDAEKYQGDDATIWAYIDDASDNITNARAIIARYTQE